ncbi:TRADD-N-associated membrane domain-containing protein [[Actinomadura] parvosata]|uniref:TRADD-N-associated membrane domain-containing protein n=1 Tax=[Actinomadura] parvosata TaxID=1955412 RepID=UPI00406C0EA6
MEQDGAAMEGILSLLFTVTAVLSFLGGIRALLTFHKDRKRDQETSASLREALKKAEQALADRQEDRLSLPQLWEVTHRRLDYYHQIATSQARQSFRNAQVVMAIGFLILVVFAALAVSTPDPTSSIVAGVLGATSTAFAAYLSRTFVRSQESAASHLRAYFGQPLEFSRYLAAERLASELQTLEEGEHVKLTADLARAIMMSPPSENVADLSDHHR